DRLQDSLRRHVPLCVLGQLHRRDPSLVRLGADELDARGAHIRDLHDLEPGTARAFAPSLVPGNLPGLPKGTKSADPRPAIALFNWLLRGFRYRRPDTSTCRAVNTLAEIILCVVARRQRTHIT